MKRKQIFSMLCALLLVFPVSAASSAAFPLPDCQYSPLENEVLVQNILGGASLYAAGYRSNGQILFVDIPQIRDNTAVIPLTQAEFEKLKLFVLDEHQTPLCPSVEIPLNGAAVDMADTIGEMDLPTLWKQELFHAAELGIPMEKVQQETLSASEMAELLDWFVNFAAPEKLEKWRQSYPALHSSHTALRRMDAMAALFLAADLVGGDYAGHNLYIWQLGQSIHINWDSEETLTSDELFGDANNKSDYDGGVFGSTYLNPAGLYYNLARPSHFSGESPFAFDLQSSSYQLSVPLSYADGILAIVRLVSSAHPELFPYTPPRSETVYLDAADVRREEIRTAASKLPEEVTGKVYYISNSGSDDNDGLSPETPWATPYRAMAAGLQYGDAVLFERGGTWYIDVEEHLGDTSRNHGYADGVHIGAYGTGEKPILRGDIARANKADFWTLYYNENGAKIWKASEPMRDSAVIVFNEGEAWAEEIFPWLDDTGSYIMADGSPFTVDAALDRDLTFCNLLPVDMASLGRTDSYTRGELYLRCDVGNPAEVYETVSVPQEPTGIDLFPHSTLRDVCILYFTMMGTHATDLGTPPKNYQLINLEIGWCGGWLQNYIRQEMDAERYKPHIAGGGASSLWLSAVENGMGAANNHGIYIRNNVFYLSRYAMITLVDRLALDDTTLVNAQPIFSGNTYVQFASRPLLQKVGAPEFYFPTEAAVKNILGDKSGTVVAIGRP